MPTDHHHIQVEEICVEVVRKPIKNLHLAVYPPEGRVRIAVPVHLDDEAARMAIVTRLPWVRRKQASVIEQARESEHEMVSGESHYVGGRRYLLEVIDTDERPTVVIKGNKTLQLRVRKSMDCEERRELLDAWYRKRLQERIPELIDHWTPRLGVEVTDWRIKRMKTKWGSCSVNARRIWINLELAKKNDRCLEYIVVHEMMHLHEPHHNDRFRALMTKHMPQWQLHRDDLNRSPLGYEDWTY
jgi:predicted metal-dependent hydrolase